MINRDFVRTDMTLSGEELDYYVDAVLKLHPEHTEEDIVRLEIREAGEETECSVMFSGEEKFERVRRITGYLVGSLERWNNAKQAEEKERVVHTLG